MEQTRSLIIPRRVTIETIFGCNASCPMCPIDEPTGRKKGLMPLELFREIIDGLTPYRDQIQMMDFYCLGEPFLDPHIAERVSYAKARGFRNLGISTNVDLLTEEKARRILEAGVDTIILSIDGVRKETHEAIRPGVIFERVVANAERAVSLRDAGGFKTRFVVRFIRQNRNRSEWQAYREFWSERLSRERGDFVTAYDVHSCEETGLTKEEALAPLGGVDERIERKPCHLPFEVLNILADGTVPLCSVDWLKGEYGLGNVKGRDPITVFNSPRARELRALHLAGEKNRLTICRGCTILYSAETKEVV